MSNARALLRGLAAGVAAGTIVFSAAMILGGAPGGSRLVFLVGAVSAAIFGLLGPASGNLQVVGAGLVGALAIGAGVATGFGWLEYSMLGGAVLAASWLATGERTPQEPWRWLSWGGVIAVILVIVLLPLIVNGGTLGHDEAAYGVKARQWLEGTPDSGWSFHRGTGMSVYGYAVLALGGEEPGLRLLGLAGAVGLAAAVWALGRRIANPIVGAIAAVAVVAGPSLLRRSTEYLSDVPAAALLVCCMVIVWRELHDRDLPSYHLLWALPPALAAFYLRYQSALSLILITVTAVVLWWPKMSRRPAPLLWLTALGLLGLVPHVLHSIELTGSPSGIVLGTGRLVAGSFAQGFRDYAGQLWWELAGFVGPIALVAALVGLVRWWRDREIRTGFLFLLVPALAQIVVLGVVAHGEPRFLFFPIALIVVAGVMTAQRGFEEVRRPWTRAIALGLSLVVIGSLALSSSTVRRSVDGRAANNEPVELSAQVVASDAGGPDCGVLTSYTPQITYYSLCASEVFRTNLEPDEAVSRLPGESKFMVLIEDGKRQPTGDDLEALVDLSIAPPEIVLGERHAGTVFQFTE